MARIGRHLLTRPGTRPCAFCGKPVEYGSECGPCGWNAADGVAARTRLGLSVATKQEIDAIARQEQHRKAAARG